MQNALTKTGVHIRNFEPTDRDYEAAVAIHNAIWVNQPATIEQFRYEDETRTQDFLYQRIVGEHDGKIVAIGSYMQPFWSFREGKYTVYVEVSPEYRRQGIGMALYEHMLERLSTYNVTMLASPTREGQTAALAMLAKYGFKQVMRFPISHLDVKGFDPAPFAGLDEKVRDQGFEIITLPQLKQRDPNWLENFHETVWKIDQDIPHTDPPTKISLEQFRNYLESPRTLPDARFFAMHDGQIAGISWLSKNLASTRILHTGLTGVLRKYRRKSVATALKLRAIEFAKNYGAEIIDTNNEENNPMYQINLKLGFKPQPAWLEFEKNV